MAVSICIRRLRMQVTYQVNFFISHPWGHVARALVGAPGPLRLDRCGPHWALVGQALVGPLGSCGLGSCGPPWALVGQTLMGPPGPHVSPALVPAPGPLWAWPLWALMGWALMGLPRIYLYIHTYIYTHICM